MTITLSNIDFYIFLCYNFLNLDNYCGRSSYIRHAGIVDGDGETVLLFQCDIGYWFWPDKVPMLVTRCQPNGEWDITHTECISESVSQSQVSIRLYFYHKTVSSNVSYQFSQCYLPH